MSVHQPIKINRYSFNSVNFQQQPFMSLTTENLGGQWIVFFEGKQRGHGLLSFNTFGSSGGYVSLYQDENVDEKTPTLMLQGRVLLVDVSSQKFTAKAESVNSQSPTEVTISGSRSKAASLGEWVGNWTSSAGYSGSFRMNKITARAFDDANIKLINDWNEFSDWAFAQEPERSVYRGLGNSQYSLESTAHRAGIFNLHHYLKEVLPRVRAELLKRHGLRIDLSAPDGLAEILALIRHHGFPSPIMDWSKSPWVALYFAITSAKLDRERRRDPSLTRCRVYCLRHSGISVVADVKQALLAPNIKGALAEIPTSMTSRVTAQEGVFLLTPCVDVLSAFMHEAKQTNSTVIEAIDINVAVIEGFLDRLDRMMINEATMLSSIDSTLNHLAKKLIA